MSVLQSFLSKSLATYGTLFLFIESFQVLSSISTGEIELSRFSIILPFLVTVSVSILIGGFWAIWVYCKETKERERLVVFRSERQRTELLATEDGLVFYLSDIQPNEKAGSTYLLTFEDLRNVLKHDRIYIKKTNDPHKGLFTMGPRFEWLYSKLDYPESLKLKDALRNIAQLTLRKYGGAKKQP